MVAAYESVHALKGMSLAVEEGEIVTLLGANGAGKSTTLRAISGLVPPQSGMLRFAGRPIGGLSPGAIVKLGLAHVPEGRRVFPGLTVRENIMLGASNRARATRGDSMPTPRRCSDLSRRSNRLNMRWAGRYPAASNRWSRWRAV